jgi:hypothetical protein
MEEAHSNDILRRAAQGRAEYRSKFASFTEYYGGSSGTTTGMSTVGEGVQESTAARNASVHYTLLTTYIRKRRSPYCGPCCCREIMLGRDIRQWHAY